MTGLVAGNPRRSLPCYQGICYLALPAWLFRYRYAGKVFSLNIKQSPIFVLTTHSATILSILNGNYAHHKQ